MSDKPRPVAEPTSRIAGKVAAGLLILMCLAGGAGLALYSEKPVRAVIGLQIQRSYLEQQGQDYEVDEAMNLLLDGMDRRERALVFVRHLYYLQIPYLNGDPTTSFEVDPERLQTPQEWKEFLEKKNVGYVVRSPGYPAEIERPLVEMEKRGYLVPYAEAEVQNLQGMRINQKRVTVPVVILRFRR